MLEIRGIQRGRSTWQCLGEQLMPPPKPFTVTIIFLGGLLMERREKYQWDKLGWKGWEWVMGQLFTARVTSWALLSPSPQAGGEHPLSPASLPRREWGWLCLPGKWHRFEMISPPAAFSVERSMEDITIYSAQCECPAGHPPANIPPVWRWDAFQLPGPQMPCPLFQGGGKSHRGTTISPHPFLSLLMRWDAHPLLRSRASGSEAKQVFSTNNEF